MTKKPTTKKPTNKKTARTAKTTALELTQGKLAILLGVTQQRISQMIQQGVFPTLPNGKLDGWRVVPTYIASLKQTDNGMDRIRTLKAQELEQRIARERNELISLEDVNYAVGMIASKFCGELAGVAAASTRDLGLREIIQSHLTAAILRFKASLAALADDAKAGKPIADDEGDVDED
ncbi:hypothetical protein V1290_007374 [Bradyrhizobium sp. AZCC 1578]|uniref:hypothetical protein n=1 Tax=Bradyrhizobium sp. AZCC 1578 TaxID=3117027 RepID=UPI002FF34848